ncbi:class I adenylate-forming enzyme family protein [Prosthecomicrobium hirschii]|uniref:class I adenylate-forming enzyme family protein n=1 Tax=Prosthecodimorpha hirschii TaxID=665126 RepID=UPI002220FAA4|nr:class I adenylate-forming enzyme family protein [Prosthecomicrobium hirschii]MCW1840757.1 acyl--CoA ligase [Prosthecomicrobium hirschii]
MSFHDHVLFNARLWPEKPAIVLMDRVVTYGMMARGIHAVAAVLGEAGLGRGAVVGVLVDLPSWNLILACALAHIGATSVPLNALDDARSFGLAFDAIVTRADVADKTPIRCLRMDERWFALAAERPAAPFAPDMICRVASSSGTTGRPKLIGIDLNAFRVRQAAWQTAMDYVGWERLMILLGITTHFAFGTALMALSCGRTVYFAADAAEAMQMLQLFRIDAVIASTRWTEVLVAEQMKRPAPLDALRCFHFGGSYATAALMDQVRTHLTPNACVQYGSTEAGCTAYGPIARMRGLSGAVGFVAPFAAIEVVDDQDRPLAAGREGILRVRSGSLGRPHGGADPASGGFRDGWHYPGDVGRIDPDGILVLSGRTDHLITAGGAKAAPEEIEQELRAGPGVRDVAVGMYRASPSAPAEAVALVVVEGRFDPFLLKQWADRTVTGAPIARFHRVDAIPRGPAGKIAREAVRALIETAT